jgi:hypothetical protein
MATASRVAWRCGLGVLLLLGLGGCVGFVRHQFDWVHVPTEVTTKAEVLTRFGEPRRTAHEADRDVWYYRLSGPGPSGRRPATEGTAIAFVLVGPVGWVRRPDENVRFEFEGDVVSYAGELRATESGFYCGLYLIHGQLFACGPMP